MAGGPGGNYGCETALGRENQQPDSRPARFLWDLFGKQNLSPWAMDSSPSPHWLPIPAQARLRKPKDKLSARLLWSCSVALAM